MTFFQIFSFPFEIFLINHPIGLIKNLNPIQFKVIWIGFVFTFLFLVFFGENLN